MSKIDRKGRRFTHYKIQKLFETKSIRYKLLIKTELFL